MRCNCCEYSDMATQGWFTSIGVDIIMTRKANEPRASAFKNRHAKESFAMTIESTLVPSPCKYRLYDI